MGPVLTVPKRLTHGEELVVLRKDEYERLLRQAGEIADALKIIAEGEQAHREGRAIRASSLKEALRLYGKRAH